MMLASSTGHVMNLSNSIIGVSLLAMPFCFKQCGITLAILLLILSSIISRLACYFLVKSSTMCRRRNFEFLAFYTFGPSGKLLVELGIIGFMMGTCVAFFVVMGDLGPAIVSKIFNINNNGTLRSSVLIGLGLLVVLPLGLLRNVESLAAISTVTIGYYFLFILKIFFESSSHLATGDWWSHVRFWQPEGILQCIPIFAMALSCQTQLFEIYNSLPSPSIEKMNSVVRSALNLCTIVYTSVGLLGYIAYCKGNFTGNIMLSFAPSLSSEMFKLGFVLSIAVSFPLVIFPCRASLFSLIFKRMPIHQELSQTTSHIPDSRFKCLTVAIVSVALVTGLLIPSIELVLGFVGSTIGVAICVIFPSLSFLNLYNKNTNERVVAKMILFLGFVIMVLGTFGNLFAAIEDKPIQSQVGETVNSKNIPQIKIPPKLQSSTESSKQYNSRGVILVNLSPPDKLAPRKIPKVIKPRIKALDNVRKEPPVPIAPLSNSRDKQNEGQAEIEKPDKNRNEEFVKKVEQEQKKTNFISEGKHSENINKDAIEKENREIMEVERQKNAEEERKQLELLQRLKEHQDEQKKLLREQEKILREMKDRENEKKLKVESKDPKFLLEEVKAIKPDEFRVNLNKIQDVIDDLKDTKSNLEKEKTKKMEEDVIFPTKKINISIENSKAIEAQEPKMQDSLKISKDSQVQGAGKSQTGPSVPLPLVKLRSTSEPKQSQMEKKKEEGMEEEGNKVLEPKPKAFGRDILVESMPGREKRETGKNANKSGGECLNAQNEGKTRFNSKDGEKTEKLIVEKTNISKGTSNRSSVLIKNSAHLSVDLPEEKKLEITDEGTSKIVLEFQNQPFMSKKRDLKSVSVSTTSS